MNISPDLYEQAFSFYADAGKEDFAIRPSFGNYYVEYLGGCYRISHFEDFMAAYKGYLETSPTHIYTELPEELWQVILSEKIIVEVENFIIDFYNSWKEIWFGPNSVGDNSKKLESDKEHSFNNFKAICTKIRNGSWDIFDLLNIDPEQFVQAFAKAIKGQYARDNEFYEEVVSLMTSRYFDQIGNGVVFAKIILDEGRNSEQIFFVYSVDGILD